MASDQSRKWHPGPGALLLMILLLPGVMAGQTKGPGAKRLRLEDALSYALQHYPAVRASLEDVNAARAEVTVARAQYLPSLVGVYGDSRATQNQAPGVWLPTAITPTVEGPIEDSSAKSYWGSQTAALFSWEPADFGLRGAIVGEAKSAVEKSRAGLAVTRLEVATAVGNYFLTALAAEQTAEAAEANVSRWEIVTQSVRTLVANSLRPGADASRADAQLAMAKIQFYQAQQGERMARARLAALLGAAGTDIELDAGGLLKLPSSGALQGGAPEQHPAAREQLAAIRERQAEETTLSKTDYPRIYLQGEGLARGSEVPNNGSILGNWNGLAPARGNWIAGVTITFPNVFDFKALGAEKQMAKAAERREHALYDKTIQDLTGEVAAAREALQGAELVAEQTPVELTAARASEMQSKARYAAGLGTLVEVADAEGLLAQGERDDAVARLYVWQSLFALAHAQGDLQPFLDVLRSASP